MTEFLRRERPPPKDMVKKTSTGLFDSVYENPSRQFISSPAPRTNGFVPSRLYQDEPPLPLDDEDESLHLRKEPTHDCKASFAPEKYTFPYMDFMKQNPTEFHACDHFSRQLTCAGFESLSERDLWNSKIKRGGKYYVTRNGSAIIAFAVGKRYVPGNGIGIVGGHIDALTAKLKPIPTLGTTAGYVQLGVAPYGGSLSATWLDRDLGIGGRVLVKDSKTGRIETKLVRLDWPIARIPTLAPHFGAPANGPYNKETQMVPIIGLDNSDITGSLQPASTKIKPGTFAATQPERLVRAIAGEMKIEDYGSIVKWELELFDIQPPQLGGLDKEFIFAGRIDDKLCCYAAIEALLASEDDGSPGIVKMVGCFDDEEIGSLLRQGARSNFMSSVIERLCEATAEATDGKANRSLENIRCGPNLLNQTLANSFFVSSDVTHAVNPNFLGIYLQNHGPRLNVGVAVSVGSSPLQ